MLCTKQKRERDAIRDYMNSERGYFAWLIRGLLADAASTVALAASTAHTKTPETILRD